MNCICKSMLIQIYISIRTWLRAKHCRCAYCLQQFTNPSLCVRGVSCRRRPALHHLSGFAHWGYRQTKMAYSSSSCVRSNTGGSIIILQSFYFWHIQTTSHLLHKGVVVLLGIICLVWCLVLALQFSLFLHVLVLAARANTFASATKANTNTVAIATTKSDRLLWKWRARQNAHMSAHTCRSW